MPKAHYETNDRGTVTNPDCEDGGPFWCCIDNDGTGLWCDSCLDHEALDTKKMLGREVTVE